MESIVFTLETTTNRRAMNTTNRRAMNTINQRIQLSLRLTIIFLVAVREQLVAVFFVHSTVISS